MPRIAEIDRPVNDTNARWYSRRDLSLTRFPGFALFSALQLSHHRSERQQGVRHPHVHPRDQHLPRVRAGGRRRCPRSLVRSIFLSIPAIKLCASCVSLPQLRRALTLPRCDRRVPDVHRRLLLRQGPQHRARRSQCRMFEHRSVRCAPQGCLPPFLPSLLFSVFSGPLTRTLPTQALRCSCVRTALPAVTCTTRTS